LVLSEQGDLNESSPSSNDESSESETDSSTSSEEDAGEEEQSLSSDSDDSAEGDGDYGLGSSHSMTEYSSAPNSPNTLDNSGDDGSGEGGEAGGEGSAYFFTLSSGLPIAIPSQTFKPNFINRLTCSSTPTTSTSQLPANSTGLPPRYSAISTVHIVPQGSSGMHTPPLQTSFSFVGSSDKGVATNRLLAKARLQGESGSLGLKGVLAGIKSSSGGHMQPTRLLTAAEMRRERLDQWRSTKAMASSIHVNTSTRGNPKNFGTSRPNHQTTTTNNNNNSFKRSRAEHTRTHPHEYATNGSSIVDISTTLTKENCPPSLTPY